MYLEHFGLTEQPFRITPHTDFFFAGANRGATLEALIYAITHDEGIVKVSGEVGSGKTMLCRVLMERLPKQVDLVYLANPSLSRDDILYAIADELGLTVPDHARSNLVLRTLQEHLVARYGEGRQVVVLIDEAHAMPAETLEEIRLLSNLESNRHKLLQLVLFGQPELNDVLARTDMRQLKERITHNFTLEPLVRDDIAQYLDFRMRAAGYRGPEVFTPAAVRLIARASLGLTRRINILADKALLASFAADRHQITPKEAKAAIHDSEFATIMGKTPRPSRLILVGASGVALLLIILWLFVSVAPTPVAMAPPPIASPTPPPPTSPSAPVPLAATPAIPTAADWSELGPVTRRLAASSQEWLARVPDEHWFLQLSRADISQAKQVEIVAARASELLKPGRVHVYAVELDGKRRIGVIYGDFLSRAEAVAVTAKLPAGLRELMPYPRQVKRLR